MRRALEIFSIVVFLAGLELAAGTLSQTIQRVEETFRLAFAGEAFVLPPAQFLIGLTAAAFGGSVFGLSRWARSQSRGLTVGVQCPRCGTETERVKRRRRHRVLALLSGIRVSRRRCGDCGWTGLSAKQ